MNKMIHNAEARQINIFDERFYTSDGQTYFPSVTTVLEAFPKGMQFAAWQKSVGFNADIIVERAANEGSKIHAAIEAYLRGEEITYHAYNRTEWECIIRFTEFWTRYMPKLEASEEIIISTQLRIGGTIDIVCVIDGKRWLLDVKSSNAVHDTHALQVAEYAMMWNEKHPDRKIDQVGIIHLKALTRGEDKKGLKMQGKGWQVVTFDQHYAETHYKVFVPLRAIWDECNPDYKPAILTLPDRVQLSPATTVLKAV